jgi:hypothetical protein
MDRDDALDAFLAVVNLCEPDHPYNDDCYPLSERNVEYGLTRTYHAKCGPRSGHGLKWAAYSTRLTHINELTREEHLALLVHEISHITTSKHGEPSHPPEFWREMAFNALLVRDSIRERENGEIWDAFGDVSEDRFMLEVVENPNGSTVDRRYETVDERKRKQADLIGRPDLL